MGAQSFLGRHFTLIIGVSLPLVLVLLFWVAMIIPRMSVADPRYDLVLASRYSDRTRLLNGNLDFELVDGRLHVRFRVDGSLPRGPGNVFPAIQVAIPRLYYFTAATGSIREIEYDIPENPADGDLIPVAALSDTPLIGESVAPDGYEFDNRYRGSRGFFFIFDGYRYNAKIEKDGRAVKVPSIDPERHIDNYQFIAWADPGGA